MVKANISWSVKQIAKATNNGTLVFDNAIQRGYVWDVKRKSMLVDSILRGFPIPPMYTVKTDIDAPNSKKGTKVYDCLDGKQRCDAIRSFRDNEFVLTGLETIQDETGDDVDINGLTYDELDEYFKDIFDTYMLTVYFFTDITDEEISEMMARLNNGKSLTGIETARIKSKCLKTIAELANMDFFTKNLSEKSISGYVNEDILIKTIIQLYDNSFDLSTKSVKNIYENFEFSESVTTELRNIIETADTVINLVCDIAKKSTIKTITKKTNLVAILYFIGKNIDVVTDRIEEFADFINDFFSGAYDEIEQYNTTCKSGTNQAKNVSSRNEILSNAFNNAFVIA